MLNKILDHSVFTSGSYTISVGQIIVFLILCGLFYLSIQVTRSKWRIEFFNRYEVDQGNRRKFEKLLRQLSSLIFGFAVVKLFNLDLELYRVGGELDENPVILRYSLIIIGLIILVSAWLMEWFLQNVIINRYQEGDKEAAISSINHIEKERSGITKLVQYIVLCLACVALLRNLNLDYEFFNYTVDKEKIIISPSKIIIIFLIFLLAKIIIWFVVRVVLYGFFKRKDIDKGARFAINQLISYVIYFGATIFAIRSMGINMTLILGGAAALLVGIGLGLQQTFNDFFSGLVLLFERTVSVGDILEISGTVVTVKKIGLRSSILETRANVSVIIPNSRLVNENVNNWTHFVNHGRFEVEVGVAYGSDTALVKKLMLQAVKDHPLILDFPSPFVRFLNFGDSALIFTVLFFSDRFMIVEDIRSDIRFKIDELFRANGIQIPFPQRDIWIRNYSKDGEQIVPPPSV